MSIHPRAIRWLAARTLRGPAFADDQPPRHIAEMLEGSRRDYSPASFPKRTSKYIPHQGERECARRVRQMNLQAIREGVFS